MSGTKEREDSLYWQVEKEAFRLQALTAMSHAKRGNRAVLCTSRKVSEEQRRELQEAGVEVVSTRGGR